MQPFRKIIVPIAVALTAGIGSSTAGNAGDVVRGEEIYNGTCIACHGEKGKGALDGVPDFTKADGVLSQSDDALLSHMTNGFQSDGALLEMPAFGGDPDLTEEDMANVLAYLRSTFNGN